MRECAGLEKLLKLLGSENEFVLENAISALKNCTLDERNAIEMGKLDSIPHLVSLLSHENDNVVREVALCLKNFASIEEYSSSIGRLNGVEKLLQIIKMSKSDSLRKVAAFLIQALAKNRKYFCSSMYSDGSIDPVLNPLNLKKNIQLII